MDIKTRGKRLIRFKNNKDKITKLKKNKGNLTIELLDKGKNTILPKKIVLYIYMK